MKQKTQIISTAPLATGAMPADIEDTELDSETEVRTLEVGIAGHGQRLDHFLVVAFPEFSRSFLQSAVSSGCLALNGHAATRPATKVRVGDEVAIELRPTAKSLAFRAEPMHLDIAYEDASLAVINKPAGLVVHPAPGNWSGTLLNGLLARYETAGNLPRAGIVHRLDKDTSGLMVVAKTRETMDRLVGLIATRLVSRHYLAVSPHPWRGEREFSVSAPIGRDPKNRLRMAVVESGSGKPARTDFKVVDSSSSGTLFHCALHTGRTHQIRVHLGSIGMPLAGDAVYGRDTARDPIARQALHAFSLAFVHPTSAAPLRWFCQPPQDFAKLLEIWGLRYNAPIAGA